MGYSLLRTTIHSSDFSSESYTYDKEGDKRFKSFSITHDQNIKFRLIKQTIKPGFNMATPWSPHQHL
jgi:glucosylceramidase